MHTPKDSIGTRSREIWEEALADISDVDVGSTTIDSNLSPMSVQ